MSIGEWWACDIARRDNGAKLNTLSRCSQWNVHKETLRVCLQLEIVYARWIVCSLSLYRDNLWRLINGRKKRIPSPLMSLWIDRQAIRRCNARHTRPITRLEIEFAANRYLGRHKESISERKSQLANRRNVHSSQYLSWIQRNDGSALSYYTLLIFFARNVIFNFNL